MRLVKASVFGFGRIASASINVDRRVIAIVGPNEAGKSTLLEALAYIDSDETLPTSRRTRGQEPRVGDDATVVTLDFILDGNDLEVIRDIELEAQPQTMCVSREAGNTTQYVEFRPSPTKPVAPLTQALVSLTKAVADNGLEVFEVPPQEDGSELDPRRVELQTGVTGLVEQLTASDSSALTVVVEAVDPITDVLALCDEFEIEGAIVEALRDILSWYQMVDPEPEVRKRLSRRRPRVLLFSEQDRNLKSSYVLHGEGADDSKALSNLCDLAQLDLAAIRATYESGDSAERETLILAANATLKTTFTEQWNQSNLSARIKTEETTLIVNVLQDDVRVTYFEERSAGVKMFVALSAFLAATHTDRPPILLIDEAETHLHINAQQDLVNTFMTQRQAAKIIYTTHSPACLPPDLGTAIRTVVPDPARPEISRIGSSFWNRADAGYSPLLFAMGAGVAAFSTVRHAVIAEGATEMILLPTLVREATDRDETNYQVVPGLAETSNEMLRELDLVAAKVVFLIDDDSGGEHHKERLMAAGVPGDRIVTIAAPGIENLLDSRAYLRVVGDLIRESDPTFSNDQFPQLGDPEDASWAGQLSMWAENVGVELHSKRVVAEKLVEVDTDLLSEYGRSVLITTDRELRKALNKT